jgi:uncharacterized protein (TIGR03663 family)
MKPSTAKKRQASSRREKTGGAKKYHGGVPESPRSRWIGMAVVLLAATLLRLLFLSVKPLHHDEGVNGFFMTQLFRNGFYRYNPSNYHGPSLYYFGLITTTLNALFYGKYGLSTFAIRLVPAVFGIGLVWLAFSLRRYLGGFGALAAAALLAVSPGMVFFSRYFIHEIPFIFFTLALALAALRYRETNRPRYLFFASASAALMFATKETCIISFVVLILAWLCARLYLHLRNAADADSDFSAKESPALSQSNKINFWQNRQILYPVAALIFVCISVLLYSSFFTNANGVADSLRTFRIWIHTGEQTTEHHAAWSTYLGWMYREEFPILALGALGIVIALWKPRRLFPVFSAFWALGISAAYALVPYKTPWLTLNLILPLAIMAGYALQQWFGSTVLRQTSAAVVLLVSLAGSLYQSIDLSFFRYDDDSIPYVYAHSNRQLLDLVHEVDQIARDNHSGMETGITIISPEFWPLPWYLRDYPLAQFPARLVQTGTPILIASSDQAAQVQKDLGLLYRPYKAYVLRPGNTLVLYLRRDLQP